MENDAIFELSPSFPKLHLRPKCEFWSLLSTWVSRPCWARGLLEDLPKLPMPFLSFEALSPLNDRELFFAHSFWDVEEQESQDMLAILLGEVELQEEAVGGPSTDESDHLR